MRSFCAALAVILCTAPCPALAQETAQFGPFSAFLVNKDVVEDVVTEGNDIYVKVAEPYQDKEFSVKISDENMAGYRRWQNGGQVMNVKVYQSDSGDKRGHTYRIHTTARFVEFWMEGNLVLHLRRSQ
jgi:hypothetical protein